MQGNLDPLALIAGGAALDRAVDDVLANYGKGRLIFNLGHGIQPETPIAHVEQMLRRVRAYFVAETRPQRLHRPAALDDLGCALGQQFKPDRAAEFARAVGRTAARGLDEAAPLSSSTDAVSDICLPAIVANPAIGELQWPLSTHSTSRSASAQARAAGSSISDSVCAGRKICARRIPPRRCPAPPPATFRQRGNSWAMRAASPTRSSPERAMISASAGPPSPPSGKLLQLAGLSSLRTRVSAAPR